MVVGYSDLSWQVQAGTVQDELGEKAVGRTVEYFVLWYVGGDGVEQVWHYSLSGVSSGSTPCEHVHSVLSWGWLWMSSLT